MNSELTCIQAALEEAEKPNKDKDSEGQLDKHISGQKIKRPDKVSKTKPGKHPSVAKRKRGDSSKEFKSAVRRIQPCLR